jgi:hypothetical protein
MLWSMFHVSFISRSNNGGPGFGYCRSATQASCRRRHFAVVGGGVVVLRRDAYQRAYRPTRTPGRPTALPSSNRRF